MNAPAAIPPAAIPFVREITFEYGVVQQVSPLIRRVIANNPGPFTFTGTGVYIIGKGNVAVIDPGPNLTEHAAALDAALEGDTVTHVFVTHSHLDHCPLAHPLAQRHGCKVYASGVVPRGEIGIVQVEAEDDHGFKPDVAVHDGDVFSGPDWTIRAVATPGHTSNHVCYALEQENALFSGDHIMGWSTTVVSPPDGDMNDYLASLAKIRAENFDTLWPTHGAPIRNVTAFIDAYTAHRHAREVQILDQLRAGQTSIPAFVPIMYAAVDARLHPAACLSVLSHMVRLVKLGRVVADGEGLGARYTLA